MVVVSGFLKRQKCPEVPECKPNRLDPKIISGACHLINNRLHFDTKFRNELEDVVRRSSGTQKMHSKFRAAKGCCTAEGEVASLRQEFINAKNWSSEEGAGSQKRRALVELISTRDVRGTSCCYQLDFSSGPKDEVGELLNTLIGSVSVSMAKLVVAASKIAAVRTASLYRKIREQVPQEAPQQEPPSWVTDMPDDGPPIVSQFKGLMTAAAKGEFSRLPSMQPVAGGREDSFIRCHCLGEALKEVVLREVEDTLAAQNSRTSRVGGVKATPAGWTYCQLTALNQEAIADLKKGVARSTVASLPLPMNMSMIHTALALLSDGGRLRNSEDAMDGQTGVSRHSAWLSVEDVSHEDKSVPDVCAGLRHCFMVLGSLPFEINKKCDEALQIPQQFLVERINTKKKTSHRSYRENCEADETGVRYVATLVLKLRGEVFMERQWDGGESTTVQLREGICLLNDSRVVSRLRQVTEELDLMTLSLFIRGPQIHS